jgi:hypothetical protein
VKSKAQQQQIFIQQTLKSAATQWQDEQKKKDYIGTSNSSELQKKRIEGHELQLTCSERCD